jgi:hypothetical protein
MSTQTTVQDVDPLALERQVCFALATANRVVLAVYRPLLEPLGLTHPQYLVMLALWGWLPAIQSRAVSRNLISRTPVDTGRLMVRSTDRCRTARARARPGKHTDEPCANTSHSESTGTCYGNCSATTNPNRKEAAGEREGQF